MMKKNIETYLADAAPCTRVTLVLGISVNRIFLILAEFGHSDRNGGILCKKRKNSAKIGMVGSYVALISHTSKILLKIIHKRMKSIIERELPDNQAGFRKARGIRDHIANMRWIMERQLEYGKEVHICFIDYSKAFDCINHELLWKTLLEMGIPKHLIQLLKGLYKDQSAVIRTEFGDTDRLEIKKGVRQGCILSPFLFNLYAERIMRKAEMEKAKEGVKIAGKTLNNLRYADDTDGRKKSGSDKTDKKTEERK